MKKFLELPYRIYQGDSNWIAPMQQEVKRLLNDKKNPYFRNASLCLFLCCCQNKVASRAIAVINYEHWERWNKKVAFFGFFESIYDQEATSVLFSAIEKYCCSKGAEYLEGPYNPHHYAELGLLVKNFEKPRFFEPYNPKWYIQRLINAGFSVKKNLFTRLNPDFRSWMPEHHQPVDISQRINGYTVRHFNVFRYRKDMEAIREINNDAFSDNYSFLPLSSKEYRYAARFMFLVTSPRLIRLIEHNNKPVGVLQAVYNINDTLIKRNRSGILPVVRYLMHRHKEREVIIYTAGVKKTYQNTVASYLLYREVCQLAEQFQVVSTTWMTDDNPNLSRTMKKLGMLPYKWFVLLSKPLKKEDETLEK